MHLQLHTGDQVRASASYAGLLHWRPEFVRAACGSYLALETRRAWAAGSSNAARGGPVWLPYIEVDRIDEATERARRLGAAVLLERREGPSGWRSVVSSREAGELALWEPT